MEPDVSIRCKKEDVAVVKSVIDDAVKEYKELMKKEVKFFFNKEVPAHVILDESAYLPVYNE